MRHLNDSEEPRRSKFPEAKDGFVEMFAGETGYDGHHGTDINNNAQNRCGTEQRALEPGKRKRRLDSRLGGGQNFNAEEQVLERSLTEQAKLPERYHVQRIHRDLRESGGTGNAEEYSLVYWVKRDLGMVLAAELLNAVRLEEQVRELSESLFWSVTATIPLAARTEPANRCLSPTSTRPIRGGFFDAMERQRTKMDEATL
ncbi:hypothetical protein DFH06DRAFT_1425803 [Mycena polygramma]|nr:hypothetical protein DFH06DRAFT_1425803 [Mycena polygramma]